MTNLPGLQHVGEKALAEELDWPLKGFRESFTELLRAGLVKADWESRVIWVPNAIKYNRPENPNVVKGWRDSWAEVPECPLKVEAYRSLKASTEQLGEPFAKAFQDSCGKSLANQEQEQEREKDIPSESPSGSELIEFALRNPSPPGKAAKPTVAQVERIYKLYPRRVGKIDAKKAILKAVIAVMAGDPDHPALPIDEALDYLAQRVMLYAEHVRGTDQKFVPYPATWFNDGRFWDDDRIWATESSTCAITTPLPADYVSASEKVRRERIAGAGGVQ